MKEGFEQCMEKNNGYSFFHYPDTDSEAISVYDLDQEIWSIVNDQNGNRTFQFSLNLSRRHLDIEAYISNNKELFEFVKQQDKEMRWSGLMDVIGYEAQDKGFSVEESKRMVWAYERQKAKKQGLYNNCVDIIPFFLEQEELSGKVIKENQLSKNIRYVAGVDVAYLDEVDLMIGAVVVLDIEEMKIVDQANKVSKCSIPYLPGFFSYREIPSIIGVFKLLKVEPDLIVCDAQGIAHPKGVGMATHLGIELDVPTIGCAKRRLVGAYDKSLLEKERGSTQPLIWDCNKVGVALRTQKNVNPVFVSIGHKIDLDSSIDWVLKLCSKYRLPETTRQADQLVNKLMKEQIKIDF